MPPPAQSVSVRFQGAFLVHPHWRLNEKGQIVLNSAGTELTILGETGGGIQRKPHALKIPTKFIVNVLADGPRVQFQVRDKMDVVAEDIFVLEFEAETDAEVIASLLPKTWVRRDAPVSRLWKSARRSSWRDIFKSPSTQVALGMSVLFGLTVAVIFNRLGDLDETWIEIGRTWGNHGAATRTGDLWRLVTHSAVHADPIDYLLQLGGLVWWGSRVERVLGSLVWWCALLAGILGGALASILAPVPDVWTCGLGAGLQGTLGATVMFLWFWKRAGAAVPRKLLRDLFVYELVVVIAELLLPGPDFPHLGGGLLLGLLVAWLSWRSPAERSEGLPPRVGRAFLAGACLLGAAWWLSPEFEYSPQDEARLTSWEQAFQTGEEDRLQRIRKFQVEHEAGQIEIAPLLYEQNRLMLFYRQQLSELKDLPLREGLRSDQRRDDQASALTTKANEAAARVKELRDRQRLRSTASRFTGPLTRAAASERGGAEFDRILEEGQKALREMSLETAAGREELERLVAQWRKLQPTPVPEP